MTAPAEPEPGRSSPVDLATKPHTTVHPQGFSMDVQPGTIAPDLVTSTSPTPVPIPEASPAPPPKSKEKEESRATPTPTPMFAPPVLSHDIFSSLPLPGGGGSGGGGGGVKAPVVVKEVANRNDGTPDSISTSPSAPAPRPDSRTQTQPDSSAAAPTTEEAPLAAPIRALSPSSSPSSSTTDGQQQQQQQQQRQAPGASLLINKAELVSCVDDVLTKTGVGMTTTQPNGNSNPDGPMSKEDFVAEALKVIQVRRRPISISPSQVGRALQAFGTEPNRADFNFAEKWSVPPFTETELLDAVVWTVLGAVRGGARVGRGSHGGWRTPVGFLLGPFFLHHFQALRHSLV